MKTNQTVAVVPKILSLLGAAACLIVATAQASFVDYYDPANWTLNNVNADGSVNPAGAPNSILVLGGNNASGTAGTTDFTIAAAASGLVSFNWSYLNISDGRTTFDSAGYVVNGVFTQVADNGSQGIGLVAFPVLSGDIFGFRVATADNLFGPGAFQIANFTAPAVPEPAVWLTNGIVLLAIGALGFVQYRRTKAVQPVAK